ncbi:hypothetical protein [Paenibacillus spongiae]|uniref:Uncharacterized protein n=1 Tax=Paenibacillus spongiae TaxID=2909671 RepID=A0ABY5SB64_9BACL|nr:hypothetical protein [Paenibacillus spongiae]UVI31179.1 hypothetical protein L1F29_04875 [Paenibacillus spongiae]
MIGKASEIKIRNFEYLNEYEEWTENNPDAEIIDFKFQAEHSGSILLVIYKEDPSHATNR